MKATITDVPMGDKRNVEITKEMLAFWVWLQFNSYIDSDYVLQIVDDTEFEKILVE